MNRYQSERMERLGPAGSKFFGERYEEQRARKEARKAVELAANTEAARQSAIVFEMQMRGASTAEILAALGLEAR